MSLVLELNCLAVTATRIVQPGTQNSGLDTVMVLGFVAAFCTIVVLTYQHKLRTRIPLLAICLVMLSGYGFLEGTMILGFSLAALSASECRQWYNAKTRRRSQPLPRGDRPVTLYERDSRIARMFGSL